MSDDKIKAIRCPICDSNDLEISINTKFTNYKCKKCDSEFIGFIV